MPYWDKNIPTYNPSFVPYTRSDSITLGRRVYYGKSLEKKWGEKANIITFKVIPVIALSILVFPIIPLLACSNVYRNTTKRILEVHHNRKLEYVEIPKRKESAPARSIELLPRPDPSTILPHELIRWTFLQGVQSLDSPQVFRFLDRMKLVCKEWKWIADELKKSLYGESAPARSIELLPRPDPSTILPHELIRWTFLQGVQSLDSPRVFRFLDRMKLVCKEWKWIVDELKKSLFCSGDIGIRDFPYVINKDHAKEMILSCPQLKALDLTANLNWTDDEIKLLLNAHPNVEEVGVVNGFFFNNSSLILTMQKLHSLTIIGPSSLYAKTNISQYSQLKKLHLYNEDDFSDIFIKSIKISHIACPLLEDLCISCTRTSYTLEKELEEISQLKHLKHLNLTLAHTFAQLSFITALKELETLEVKSSNATIWLDPIPDLIKLRKLTVVAQRIIFSFGCKPFKFPTQLKELNIQISLDLKTASKFEIKGLEKYDFPSLNSLTELKKLHLGGDSLIMIPHWTDLSQLDQLEELSIDILLVPLLPKNLKIFRSNGAYGEQNDFSRLKAVEQLQLRNLLRPPDFSSFENLKRLHLHTLTELENFSFLDQLSELQALEIATRINKFPSFVAWKKLKSLGIHTRLPVFPRIDSLELLDLVLENSTSAPNWDNLPNLRILHISDLKSTSASDNFFDNLPRLEVLCLQDCEFKELPNLKPLKNLKTLYISSCWNLRSIQSLAQFPHLRICMNKNRYYPDRNDPVLDLNAYVEELIT